ncbi:MAG: DegT/DnrJ/EryC1/StrS family aminotransferase [Candidatus Omnitrophica bacterium]|nr:DegT/DnrJ/EryC1/StrS family aminotransferase [Candidatus Omnitrophota bacterium]
MPVPLIDLVAQYRAMKGEIDGAIQQVLDRGQFILGPEVEALEREVAAYCGTRYAVGVASGTDALELALRAWGIGRGDEVITSAFSFIAAAEAVVAVGATPVFVDIDAQTFALDPGQAVDAITSKTKAIIPVHLFGHPCDMEPILALARRHRLLVLEDCAQAIGARCRGKLVGSFGDAAIVSFYPSKNLGAYGDGGMVLTNDEVCARQVRLLRAHGSVQRYHHDVLGRNSRLDEMQAAIVRIKLRHLDEWNLARRRHALAYAQAIEQQHLTHVELPGERAGCEHVYHLYTIRVADRDRVQQALEAAGISTQVAYPSILPEQPALRRRARSVSVCPTARRAAAEVLSLPMYPELTAVQINDVVQQLANALQRSG